jgi:hypothetical protein
MMYAERYLKPLHCAFATFFGKIADVVIGEAQYIKPAFLSIPLYLTGILNR